MRLVWSAVVSVVWVLVSGAVTLLSVSALAGFTALMRWMRLRLRLLRLPSVIVLWVVSVVTGLGLVVVTLVLLAALVGCRRWWWRWWRWWWAGCGGVGIGNAEVVARLVSVLLVVALVALRLLLAVMVLWLAVMTLWLV